MRALLMSLAILGLLAAGEARADDKPRGDKRGKKVKKMKQEPGPGKHLKGLPGRPGKGVEAKGPQGPGRMGPGRMGPGGKGMGRGARRGGEGRMGMGRGGPGSRIQRGGGMQGRGHAMRRMMLKRLLQARRSGGGQGRKMQTPHRPMFGGLDRLKAMKGGNRGAFERGKPPSREMGRSAPGGQGRWLEALKKLRDAKGKAGKDRGKPRPPAGKKGHPGPAESEF